MGTRNLTMVIQNQQTKVAQYGQWDGYPGGQGLDALRILKAMDLQKFRDKVSKCKWLTDEQIEKIDSQTGGFEATHPHLSRDIAAQILKVIYESDNGLELINKEDFAEDSLMCEWAYVVDLDKNTFEVYEGFNTEPLAETERFYTTETMRNEYHPVKFLASFDLLNLPTEDEFLSIETA